MVLALALDADSIAGTDVVVSAEDEDVDGEACEKDVCCCPFVLEAEADEDGAASIETGSERVGRADDEIEDVDVCVGFVILLKRQSKKIEERHN
ncbi:MAG TPA: hypothetical protein V6C97_00900 [Oculatellaceae cyanobacterium]